MKKTLKRKLTLHRETLRNLELQGLRNAAGGGTQRTCGDTCNASCITELCTFYSECPSECITCDFTCPPCG